MQTTLRLNDHLYRRAKATAAELGISLTRFLEDALQHRLQSSIRPRRRKRIRLPVSTASGGLAEKFRSFDEAVKTANLAADRHQAR